MLRGYGNGQVVTLGSTTFFLRVDKAEAEVEEVVVPDSAQDVAVLVGQTFTELPGFLVQKDKDRLLFDTVEDRPISTIDLEIPLSKLPLYSA